MSTLLWVIPAERFWLSTQKLEQIFKLVLIHTFSYFGVYLCVYILEAVPPGQEGGTWVGSMRKLVLPTEKAQQGQWHLINGKSLVKTFQNFAEEFYAGLRLNPLTFEANLTFSRVF